MRRFFCRPPLWAVLLALAIAWQISGDGIRARRVERVSAQPVWSAPPLTPDAGSPTGYAEGRRRLIAPDRNAEAYAWIMQVQRSAATGEWRLRRVDYDNAPHGRELNAPLLYRLWLALAAWVDHTVSGRSFGAGVEHAAVWAGPALHLLLIGCGTGLAAWQFGRLAAVVVVIGTTAVYPFAGGFLPGVPDHRDLANALLLGSLLLLLAGQRARRPLEAAHEAGHVLPRHPTAWFAASGVAGGLGLWVDVAIASPAILGLTLGGFASAWLGRRRRASTGGIRASDWRWWAGSGVAAAGIGCLLDCFPTGFESHLQRLTPWHGLAWLALAELVAQAWPGDEPTRRSRPALDKLLAPVAVTGLGLAIYLLAREEIGFLPDDARATHLTNGPGAAIAPSLLAWALDAGMSWMLAAALVPLAWIVFAGWRAVAGPHHATGTGTLWIWITPVAIGMVAAGLQLRCWHPLEVCLVVLATALAANFHGEVAFRRLLAAVTLIIAAVGVVPLVQELRAAAAAELTPAEAGAVIERDLSLWLARRAEAGAVVWTTPALTSSVCFHGGLRGLGTPFRENRSGLTAATRIAAATTPEEAEQLLQNRRVTQLVLASWDTTLDEFAGAASRTPEATFIAALHRWEPPAWLRPVPYYFPPTPGFEQATVAAFDVVDEQRRGDALANLAEYFLEIGRADLAEELTAELRRFPGDLSPLAALVHIAASRGDERALGTAMGVLLPTLQAGADETLAWDRRVSLGIALAQGKRLDLATAQLRRCLAEADADLMRSLSPSTLRRLLILAEATHLEWPDAALPEQARQQLPPLFQPSAP